MEELCARFLEAWEADRIDKLVLIPMFILDFPVSYTHLDVYKRQTIDCPDEKNQIDLKKLMADLGNRGIDSILLEGGGTLNDSAPVSYTHLQCHCNPLRSFCAVVRV